MNFKDNKPIYMQIVDRLCDEILSGNYAADNRIPSVREYAAIVEVNANTVMRAYDTLQSLNIIYNKRGIGYFVCSEAKAMILEQRKNTFLNEEIEYFFKQMLSLDIDSESLTQMYNQFCNKHKNNKQ